MSAELELIKENRESRYPHSCPFVNRLIKSQGYVQPECMHCYELFPGWAETYIRHSGIRDFFQRPYEKYAKRAFGKLSACPCHVLGEAVVKKIVKLKEAETYG